MHNWGTIAAIPAPAPPTLLGKVGALRLLGRLHQRQCHWSQARFNWDSALKSQDGNWGFNYRRNGDLVDKSPHD